MIFPKQFTQVRKSFFGGFLLSAGLGLIAVTLGGFYAMAADPVTPVPDKIPCAVRDILCDTPESIHAVSEACYVEVGNPLMVNAGCGISSSTPLKIFQTHCKPLAWKA
jgi:hypothetical protein